MKISKILFALLKSVRPRQWIKNVSLYAALLFSGFLFYDPIDGLPYFVTVTIAVILFSLLASSIYLFNDIVDSNADRHHPFKSKRPIASGELPVPIALFAAVTGLAVVVLCSMWLHPFFLIIAIAYLLIQILYTRYLKHMPILDISTISTSFLLRVYAGAVVVNLHMSVWFLLTVLSASLFLAVGKRQSERTFLKSLGSHTLGSTRKILTRYSQRLLDQYTAMFATATWLTYALFAFQTESSPNTPLFIDLYTALPRSLHSQKLLMLTLPFVIYGVMRYLHLIYSKNEGESPERVLTTDIPLLVTAFLFGLMVFLVVYVVG